MTTRSSPITQLKAQANAIARQVKSLGKNDCKFAICMDDKTIVVEQTDVLTISEKELAKLVLDLMQEN